MKNLTDEQVKVAEKLVLQAGRHLGGTFTVDDARRHINSEGWKVGGETLEVEDLLEIFRGLHADKKILTPESHIHGNVRWMVPKYRGEM